MKVGFQYIKNYFSYLELVDVHSTGIDPKEIDQLYICRIYYNTVIVTFVFDVCLLKPKIYLGKHHTD